MQDIWKPAVTVAAIIERDGRFLLVEEEADGARVLNQPAGHWEPGETLAEACSREALEESACRFEPRALVGVYHWCTPNGIAYLRFAFCGDIAGFDAGRPLDQGIVRALWMSADELRRSAGRHRSPLVARCVEDYLAGRRFALDLVRHVG